MTVPVSDFPGAIDDLPADTADSRFAGTLSAAQHRLRHAETNASVIATQVTVADIDVSDYVTLQQFTDAVPGKFVDLTDVYANGLASARGDQWMDDGAGNLMRVPKAIWTDTAKRDRLLAGTGGSSPIRIVNTALSAGQVGVVYSQTVTSTGGAIDTNSYREWKIVGSLPTGLTFAPADGLNSGPSPYGRAVSATITGTPAAAQQGTYSVTITVRDALENTATLTANIVIAAAAAALVFTMPTLPNAKCGTAYSQSLASAVSGGTGPYTFTVATYTDGLAINSSGLITGTTTTPQQVSISVTVTDFLMASLTRSGTILIESQATVRFDLADLIGAAGGAYTYTGLAGRPSTVDPAYNVTQLNSRASQAAGNGAAGGLYSSQGTIASPGTIMIGNTAGATSWNAPLLVGAACRNWDCGNVEFKLANTQPGVPVSSNVAASLLTNTSPGASQVYLRFNGNSANQPTTTTGNPTYGSYSHGVRWWTPTAAVKGTFVIKNVRGVVGGNVAGQATEVFHGQIFGGQGGDNIILTLNTDDGTTNPINNSASGFKWQYTVNSSANASPVSTVLATCTNVRHGIGGYALGNLQVETGSAFTDCGSAWNIEAGVCNSTSYPSRNVTIGRAAGATNGQVTTTRCGTDWASTRYNGNNTGNARADATIQIGSVTVWGHDSVDDCSSIFIVGTAPNTGYVFHNQRVTQPTLIAGSNRSSVAALEYGSGANSTGHLTNSAKTTLVASNGGSEVGCTVHWTGTVGRQCRPGANDAAGYANTTGTYTVV